jgi:hypothetical protein
MWKREVREVLRLRSLWEQSSKGKGVKQMEAEENGVTRRYIICALIRVFKWSRLAWR